MSQVAGYKSQGARLRGRKSRIAKQETDKSKVADSDSLNLDSRFAFELSRWLCFRVFEPLPPPSIFPASVANDLLSPLASNTVFIP